MRKLVVLVALGAATVIAIPGAHAGTGDWAAEQICGDVLDLGVVSTDCEAIASEVDFVVTAVENRVCGDVLDRGIVTTDCEAIAGEVDFVVTAVENRVCDEPGNVKCDRVAHDIHKTDQRVEREARHAERSADKTRRKVERLVP